MSFVNVQEIIDNCTYLSALNDVDSASTEILDNLLPYDDPKVRALEERLKVKQALNFETIFFEPSGYYLFKSFLKQGHGPEKAIFLMDAESYGAMGKEPARLKMARMIFDRYLTEKGMQEDSDLGVFESLKSRSRPDSGGSASNSTSGSGRKQASPVRRPNDVQQSDTGGVSSFRGMGGTSYDDDPKTPRAQLDLIGSTELLEELHEDEMAERRMGLDRARSMDVRGVPVDDDGIEDDQPELIKELAADAQRSRGYGSNNRADGGGGDYDDDDDDVVDDDDIEVLDDDVPPPPPAPASSSSKSSKSKKKTSGKKKTTSKTTGSSKSTSKKRSTSSKKASGTTSAKKTTKRSSSNKKLKKASSTGSKRKGLRGGKGGGGSGSSKRSGRPESSSPANAIEVAGHLVREVASHLSNESAPKHLFQPIVREVRKRLVNDLYPLFKESEFYRLYIQTKHLEEAHVGPEDFRTMRTLGRGGFGTVYAVVKMDSGKLYAMKAINKKLIKAKRAVGMTMLERHTLSLVESRFVCSLSYAFQDKSHLYLVMDLMAGGDLKFHLTKRRSSLSAGFSEDRARFHAAEILLGLEAMHAKYIIFRDLKLENVLLDNHGHCKISDLGLVALYGKKKITHYAGTPGYIAPEVARKQPYGPAVDIFSFGVTLYRMLSGKKPFRGHSRQDFDKAVCTDDPVFDMSVFSAEAVSLIRGCLEKDPKRRMEIPAIKEHPFFNAIDWGLLEIGYLDPPFVPNRQDVNANSLDEIGFDETEAKKYEKILLDEKFRNQVHGFDYVSKDAVQAEIVAAIRKRDLEQANSNNKAAATKSNSCCVIL